MALSSKSAGAAGDAVVAEAAGTTTASAGRGAGVVERLEDAPER